MEGGLTGDIIAWLSGHTRWLGPAIFLISLLESLAIAGIVVPGVALLFAASALAGSAQLGLTGVLLWAFAGAVCGDMISFALGRIFHQDIRRIGLFRKHPQWIDGGEGFFRRYGVLSVLIGRFVGPIRPIIPLVAGMFDMPVLRFVAINVVSAALWAPAYLLPGYVTGNALKWPVPEFFWTQALGLLGSFVGLAVLALMAFRTQERWAPLIAAALSLAGLAALILAIPWLGIFSATVTAWLEQPGSGVSGVTRKLLTPFDEPLFMLLLAVGPSLALLITAQWRQLAYILLTFASALAVGWMPGTASEAPVVSLTLSLLLATTVLCNRDQGFWVRMSWGLYCAPLLVIVITAALTPPNISPLTALATLLQAGFAASLALWLVERGAPLEPMPRWLRLALPAWPGVAAALILATTPGWL